MSNYVPHYTKKKRILERREDSLIRLIAAGASEEELQAAAEVVRDARVRVLEARRATIVPKDDAKKVYDRIDARIRETENTPASVILLELGSRITD